MSGERHVAERRADHVRVEVALAAEPRVGVELRDGDVQRREPVGVEAALDVAFEHAAADVADVRQHALEQRRLAGARRAHEVDDGHAGRVEVGAVRARDRVVGVEDALDDPDLRAVHLHRPDRQVPPDLRQPPPR